MAPRRCEIHSKPQPLLQRTCLFHAFEALAAYACFGPCMQAATQVHGLRATLVFYFQKQIIAHLKSYIFHFNTPQVNLISDWALNQLWALEFEHHWRTGARVVKGTKYSVYIWYINYSIEVFLKCCLSNKLCQSGSIGPCLSCIINHTLHCLSIFTYSKLTYFLAYC